jgi:hypothetical protein
MSNRRKLRGHRQRRDDARELRAATLREGIAVGEQMRVSALGHHPVCPPPETATNHNHNDEQQSEVDDPQASDQQ